MWDYDRAAAYLNGRPRRKYANNTYIEQVYPDQIAVVYHGSHVVTWTKDTSWITFDLCGWNTPTTRQRINWFLPANSWLYSEGGEPVLCHEDAHFWLHGKHEFGYYNGKFWGDFHPYELLADMLRQQRNARARQRRVERKESDARRKVAACRGMFLFACDPVGSTIGQALVAEHDWMQQWSAYDAPNPVTGKMTRLAWGWKYIRAVDRDDPTLLGVAGHDATFEYHVDRVIEDPRWDGGTNRCGGGLHCSPTREAVRAYQWLGTILIRVLIDLNEMTIIGRPDNGMYSYGWKHVDKVKVPRFYSAVKVVD